MILARDKIKGILGRTPIDEVYDEFIDIPMMKEYIEKKLMDIGVRLVAEPKNYPNNLRQEYKKKEKKLLSGEIVADYFFDGNFLTEIIILVSLEDYVRNKVCIPDWGKMYFILYVFNEDERNYCKNKNLGYIYFREIIDDSVLVEYGEGNIVVLENIFMFERNENIMDIGVVSIEYLREKVEDKCMIFFDYIRNNSILDIDNHLLCSDMHI